MNQKYSITAVAAVLAVVFSNAGEAQTVSSEDFTGPTTQNNWYYYNGACLTTGTGLGTGTAGVTPGVIPSCKSILSSYYQQQNDHDPVLVGGQNGVACTGSPLTCTQTLPDASTGSGSSLVYHGALRFTNGYPYGHDENGAIISSTPFNAGQGVQITFKTVTYRGDSGGSGGDGADGISFYLIDATQFPSTPTDGALWNGIGSWGGSLAYSCSNTNPPYDGLVGGYIGLGIDEFGNFLNGVSLMPGTTSPAATGDNTALGYGYQPQRIGLRGAGSVSWKYLNATYPQYYGALTTSSAQHAAVQKTCQTGKVWTYSSSTAYPTASATNPVAVTNPSPALYDYAPIPGAFSVLPAKTIAGEYSSGVYARPTTAIFYNLTITQDGYLSLSYALSGSPAYTNIIKDRSIAATNAIPALPASLYFGFAGSSGGDTNVHEIMCFKAAPAAQSANSAAVSQQLATKIQGGAQIYFSYYNPSDWTGNLTANGLVDTTGVLTINSLANWDAQCVLTGVAATKTCATTGVGGAIAPQSPSSRIMLTWNGNDTAATPGTGGIPFAWSTTGTGITTNEQSVIDAGDATPLNGNRLNYLRGDRSNEINSLGAGLFRARNGVLGDIVDSSPAWVGPPTSPYSLKWKNRYIGTDPLPENTSQSYASFQALEQSRLNVVYVGANDGFLHGFESGSEDSNGNVITTTAGGASTPNDGEEVLAYMPGAVLQTIHQYSSNAAIEPTDASLDYANSLYAHNFFVDAPPGTGDLLYGGVWHTWLMGGLGAGGAAIYALDITNPSASATNPNASNFSEGNAAALVKGEWGPATISCVGDTSTSKCGNSLGSTYGTPLIRRFHNGMWGAVFGNGYGSVTGDAGIFVMTISPSDTNASSPTFYYLSTGTGTGTTTTPCSTNCNGIAYVTSADLDGDHITDYVYAGDLKGNVWRFDLTNCSPTSTTTACPGVAWAVTPGPLFKAISSAGVAQPITTPIVLASAVVAGTSPSLMLTFGTGQRTEFTTTTPVLYAGSTVTTPQTAGKTQTLYGVWDWNFGTWNANSAFGNSSLTGTQTGLSSPYTLKRAQLQQQTYTETTTTINGISIPIVTTSNTAITWKQCGTTCNSGKFGWYADLPGANEQIVSTPTAYQQGLAVNSTIPANNAVLSCTSTTDTGVTYLISPITGGTFASTTSPGTYTSGFVNNNNYSNMVGLQTNETGALTVVNTNEGTTWLVGQSIVPPSAGQPPVQPVQINLPPNVTVSRKTWVQLR
jgi:type IV pilus assembly protein PilY1